MLVGRLLEGVGLLEGRVDRPPRAELIGGSRKPGVGATTGGLLGLLLAEPLEWWGGGGVGRFPPPPPPPPFLIPPPALPPPPTVVGGLIVVMNRSNKLK